jgi:hypothetical protein
MHFVYFITTAIVLPDGFNKAELTQALLTNERSMESIDVELA